MVVGDTMSMHFSKNHVPYHVEFNNLISSYSHNGVLDGFEVNSYSGFALNVSFGQCMYNGQVFINSNPTNVIVEPAHHTYSRIDIVVYNSYATGHMQKGTLVIKGGAGIVSFPPDIPDNCVLLALIHIPANSIVIGADQIVDERIFVKPIGLIYNPSDDFLKSDDTEIYTTSNDFVKIKAFIELPLDLYSNQSILRIIYDIRANSNGKAFGRIYKNGIYVGPSIAHASDTYQTYSSDVVGWGAGDTIELWGKVDGDRAYYRNFRVYGYLKFIGVYY